MVRSSGESVGTGGGLLKPGRYMFQVEACNAHTAKSGNEGFHYEATAISGTEEVPGGNGKTLRYCYASGEGLRVFAAALWLTDKVSGEIYTPEKLKQDREDRAAGKTVADCDFDEAEAEGRFFCANVVLDKPKDGVQYPKIGFEIMSPLDPAAKDIPKDPDVMAELAGQPVGAAGNGAPKGKFDTIT